MRPVVEEAASSVRASAVARAGVGVVLGGGHKPQPLAEAAGTPIYDLPFDRERTIGAVWDAAFDSVGIPPESRLVVMSQGLSARYRSERPPILCVTDSDGYRGPAGALRDAVDAIEATSPVVALEGSRAFEPQLVCDLVRGHFPGQITVGVHEDGTFAGVVVADLEAIALVPRIGFIDLKEQWLPAAARNGFRVVQSVVSSPSYPVRFLSGYLGAMEQLGRFDPVDPVHVTVVGASGSSLLGRRFGGALIAKGSRVDPGAVVSHSVVADEAVVEAEAIVVRSVIAPGAIVRRGEVVVDRVVPATDDHANKKTSPGRTRSG